MMLIIHSIIQEAYDLALYVIVTYFKSFLMQKNFFSAGLTDLLFIEESVSVVVDTIKSMNVLEVCIFVCPKHLLHSNKVNHNRKKVL